MYRNIIKQLKTLKHQDVNPSNEWLENNRGLLLSQIKNTVTQEPSQFKMENVWQSLSIFLPQSFVNSIVRPALALALIMGMVGGGWLGTVSASAEALPGDWLYAAKKITEQTQAAVVAVVGDKKAEASLHVEFAKRRAIETKKIISDPQKIGMAMNTVNDLKNEIQTVSSTLNDLKTNTDASVSAQTAKDISQNAVQIQDVLTSVKTDLLTTPTSTAASLSDLTTRVAEAKNLTKDTAVKAMEVMVTKHLQGDNSVSKDEVKQVINNQLQSAVADAAVSQQNTADVNQAINIVKTEVAAISKDAKQDKNTSLVSSTQVLSTKLEAASIQTQVAVSQTQQVGVVANQQASEGQQLLSQGNLLQAVDKVKVASDATKVSEQIADNTIKTVQTVLPVVSVVGDKGVSSSISAVVITSTPSSSSTVGIVVSSSTVIILPTSTVK
ncbi:MAG: DUF5667 domain-containing protein [Patescibacteria group bacterium]